MSGADDTEGACRLRWHRGRWWVLGHDGKLLGLPASFRHKHEARARARREELRRAGREWMAARDRAWAEAKAQAQDGSRGRGEEK